MTRTAESVTMTNFLVERAWRSREIRGSSAAASSGSEATFSIWKGLPASSFFMSQGKLAEASVCRLSICADTPDAHHSWVLFMMAPS